MSLHSTADIAKKATECGHCHQPIARGQHYLRLVILFDTAGLEAVFAVPEVAWSGIFDRPDCAVLGLVAATRDEPVFADVFERVDEVRESLMGDAMVPPTGAGGTRATPR